MGRIAVIDCQVGGISGDMLLSSLVDAGANKKRVSDAGFECQNFLKGSVIHELKFERRLFHGLTATRMVFKYKDDVKGRKGYEMYSSLARCCEHIGISAKAKNFALESLKRIVRAESAVHGQPFNRVVLHESSSIDTFVDLIGCAVALEDLGLFKTRIFATKIAVGSGRFKFSHGVVPIPGNAIIQIFKGLPFTIFGTPAEEELTTPTGAAMLATLSDRSVDFYPAMSPERSGYGAGQRSPTTPNILRILIGKSPQSQEVDSDSVFVVETHIDDLSGEILGDVIEKIDKEGALDISVVQGISKKNRPVYIVKIILDLIHLDDILDLLFAESGTLGARVQEVRRILVPRSIVTMSMSISGRPFNTRVKIARDQKGDIINIKPEFEDIRNISRTMGLTTKAVMDLAKAETIQRFGETKWLRK
ncbi:MAG: nickel pincer cofactor biosynthesis protein LarC [Thermoproteota archaeon]|nr:nickel pincer cofactor biosynthesis protein LarC [Thermoproteota archaeon]